MSKKGVIKNSAFPGLNLLPSISRPIRADSPKVKHKKKRINALSVKSKEKFDSPLVSQQFIKEVLREGFKRKLQSSLGGSNISSLLNYEKTGNDRLPDIKESSRFSERNNAKMSKELLRCNSNFKKTNQEFKIDSNKADDSENILKSNEEYLSYIGSLLSEINLLKISVSNSEERNRKLYLDLEEMQKHINSITFDLEFFRKRTESFQSEVKLKNSEIQEQKEQLRSSEELKNKAFEDLLESESKILLLQRRSSKTELLLREVKEENLSLSNKNKEMASQIEKFETEIKEKNLKIEELRSKRSQLNNEIKNLNSQISSNSRLFEDSRISLLKKIDTLTLNIESLKLERSKSLESIASAEENAKARRSHRNSVVGSKETKYFSDLAKDENFRLKSRCEDLEKELGSVKEVLAKHEKNEVYFKLQLNEKNCIIKELENKVIFSRSGFPDSRGPSVKNTLIDSVLDRFKKFLKQFDCEICKKNSELVRVYIPCFHNCCRDCSGDESEVCSHCANKVNSFIFLPIYGRTFELIQSVSVDLVRLKD